MGLFQAGALNYPKALQNWFGISLSKRIPLGMMALVYDFDLKQHSLEHAKITRKLSAEAVHWFTKFQKNIREKAASLGEGAPQFYIPINFPLAIVKNPNKADIILSSGTSGEESLILEVPKDPDKTHPYRQKDVLEQVNHRLDEQLINGYDIQSVRKVYNVSTRAEFYYKSNYGPRQYSPKFVDWIIEQATKNPNFFLHARKRLKELSQNIV